jgi:protein-disulfide isomerase
MNRRRFLQASAAFALAPVAASAQQAADLLWLYDDIVRDKLRLSDGNPDGDVVIIEFFDYLCPYCRAIHPTLKRLLAEDPQLLIAYKEWPALGKVSDLAARLAVAARWQGKYAAAHDALVALPGRLTEERLKPALAAAGIDMAALERDLQEQRVPIERLLRQTGSQARQLRLDGTPAFIIGGEVRMGPEDGELRDMVAAARRQNRAR